MATRGVYKFHWDCGRMGALHGLFTATDDEIRSAIGKRAYFDEVLGKHSEIEGLIEPGEITLATDDPDVVRAVEVHGLQTGYNPLDYLIDGLETTEDGAA